MPKIATPPLAHYRDLNNYKPAYGDFVVWSGWLTTWHGVVTKYDNENLSIIFSTMPLLLFTLTPEELDKETYTIKLSKIISTTRGNWAFLQHDQANNLNIWYF